MERAWVPALLALVAEIGKETVAAELVPVHRNTVHRAKRRDPEFRAALERAHAAYRSRLVESSMRRLRRSLAAN